MELGADDDGGLRLVSPASESVLRATGPWCQNDSQLQKPRLSDPAEIRDFCCRGSTRQMRYEAFSEEFLWNERRRQSGACGRIVSYDENEKPQEDIIFRDGANGRVVVHVVREGGKAWTAGVTADDVLVSIDGKKDFHGMSARELQLSLEPPATLVFLGFVGKLSTEVRLTHRRAKLCGLSMQQQVTAECGEHMAVIDEVVFDPVSPSHSASSRICETFGTSAAQERLPTSRKLSDVFAEPVMSTTTWVVL